MQNPHEVRIRHVPRTASNGNHYSRFEFGLEAATDLKQRYAAIKCAVDTISHRTEIPTSVARQYRLLNRPAVAGQPFQLCFRFPSLAHLCFSCEATLVDLPSTACRI